MGLIGGLVAMLFGNGRNALKDTVEVFRENAEAAGQRDAAAKSAVLQQFAAEFAHPRKGWFDRFIDGLNRLPRPALALGTLALFVTAMTDPIWFASRMQGIALVPEPLWWLLGAIVSFYFGARHQAKGQEFQRSVAAAAVQAPMIHRNIRALEEIGEAAESTDGTQPEAEERPPALFASGPNPALEDWRRP